MRLRQRRVNLIERRRRIDGSEQVMEDRRRQRLEDFTLEAQAPEGAAADPFEQRQRDGANAEHAVRRTPRADGATEAAGANVVMKT
jgi:hypothetical protein